MAKNDNSRTFKALEADYRTLRRRLPQRIAITAVNFFKRNFRVGGFVDRPFTKWKDTVGKKTKRKTLVQSGNLRRSIKKIKVTERRVIVGVAKNIPYAQIHNEGGTIPITPKMRRYFWAMFKQTNNEFYRNLALTKKDHIDIPKRQFIGDSVALDIALQRMIVKELNKLAS